MFLYVELGNVKKVKVHQLPALPLRVPPAPVVTIVASLREAKFKTSLRVGFFLDFRNFVFASSAARIKKYP